MYNPDPFRNSDASELRAFIREHPFATLVSAAEEGPFASHIPLYLEEGGEALVGHVARGNGHWRLAGAKTLAIFHGPHAYISASWYGAQGVVPTWNYVAGARLSDRLAAQPGENAMRIARLMRETGRT